VGVKIRLTFRKATIDDARILYDWRNDPETRENSFASTKEILFEEHISWLSEKLQNDQAHIFILLEDDVRPIGQVRFDIFDKVGTVSIIIDSSFRGLGYGREGLKMLRDHIFSSQIAVCLKAFIKKTNLSSLDMFRSAGFSAVGVEMSRGEEFIVCMLYR
jgi:RimJ/RimL family protein N-acetyltransferase